MRYIFVVLMILSFIDSIKAQDNIESSSKKDSKLSMQSIESSRVDSKESIESIESSRAYSHTNNADSKESKENKQNIESKNADSKQNTKSSYAHNHSHNEDSKDSIESKNADSKESIESSNAHSHSHADSIDSNHNHSHSHSADSNTHKIESVITTGSAMQSDVIEIPGHVDVVKEKQINETTNAKVADVVKKLAGVRVDNDVGFNPRPQIKIRGLNYGTLIMLDNVILTDLEGENRLLNQISLFDVKRVEVARGAFSSLYGTNAIGGVINFITSMPKSFEIESVAGFGSEFIPDTADKNLAKLYFSIGNAFLDKKLRLKFSAGLTTTQGYASYPVYVSAKPPNTNGGYTDKAGRYVIGDGGRREYKIWDTRLKLEYDIGDSGLLSSMFSLSNHNYEMVKPKSYITDSTNQPIYTLPNGGGTPFVGSGFGGIGSYTHFLGNIAYTHFFDSGELKISLSSVNLFSRWHDAKSSATPKPNLAGGSGYTQDITTSSNYLDIIHHHHFSDIHALTSALQFRYLNFDMLYFNLSNWLDSKSVAGSAYQGAGGMAFVASGFVNWEARWLENLTSILGARYDYWLNFSSYAFGGAVSGAITNSSKSNFSPKFSLNYQPLDSIIFKTSIGSGFRMPTIREKFQSPHGNEVWQSAPHLKNETGLSFEIGAETDFKYAHLHLYYFHTELYDMIYRIGAGNAADPFRYDNAGQGRINGVEVILNVPIWRALRLESNYTLTMARVIKNSANPRSIGKQLVNVPEHMANISLIWDGSELDSNRVNGASSGASNAMESSDLDSLASKVNSVSDKGHKRNWANGFYGSIWAYFTSAFYNDDINSAPLYHTFRNYDAQFTLNAKLGYIFNNGIDISASFLNMTNNRFYDSYLVPGSSFYLQTRYKL